MLLRILVAIFSTGWIAPFWASGHFLFEYLQVDLIPHWHGHIPPLASFPYLHFSSLAFTAGCLWLAAVVFFWALRWSKPQVRP
jgi:hypothetical protein